MQKRVKSLSQVALQKQMALDLLLASQGEVCTASTTVALYLIKVVECLQMSRKSGNKHISGNAQIKMTPPGHLKKSESNLLHGYPAGLG